ncbi:MAG: ROK family protein [Pseudomonadota bacterium]|nr:ROK family protein [Pseudomonadota bacterium]
MTGRPLLAAIETGGTKCIVSVGRDPTAAARHRIETDSPSETTASIERILRKAIGSSSLDAIGIASFGPLDVDPESADYGQIGPTPKPHWEGFNLRSHLQEVFDCPVMSESDVNGAALAEAHWQLDRPIQHLAYVTVGTGIGVGVVQNGSIVNGRSHPEIGHIRVKRHPIDRTFSGTCPFHGDCLEGLASGPAIAARWGASLTELNQDHPGLVLEGFYLGQLAVNLALHHRPDVIVFGGGVSKTPGLLERIRHECLLLLGDYLPELASPDAMETLIISPRLENDSGILGAFMIAQYTFSRTSNS